MVRAQYLNYSSGHFLLVEREGELAESYGRKMGRSQNPMVGRGGRSQNHMVGQGGDRRTL